MPESNTVSAVVDIMRRLGDGGAPCLLFGGWAEEAFGHCQPRPHADIDLLLRSFRQHGAADRVQCGALRLRPIHAGAKLLSSPCQEGAERRSCCPGPPLSRG